jgi:hypothetical protein
MKAKCVMRMLLCKCTFFQHIDCLNTFFVT